MLHHNDFFTNGIRSGIPMQSVKIGRPANVNYISQTKSEILS